MYKREDMLVKVAILYYEEEKTQAQIAEQLNISRPTVSTMLKEAKEQGIVRITIHHSNTNIYKQQRLIADYYNLQHVLIAPISGMDEDGNKPEIGRLTADFIEKRLPNYRTIGIGWGTTMYEFIQAASFLDNQQLEIVPLMGGIGINDVKYHSNHLAFQLAEKYQSDVSYYYAPAIAENKIIYDAFNSSELVNEIYKKGKNVDLAIAGVGNPIESSTYRQLGYITENEKDLIKESGAIGDILGSFFNKDGVEVPNDVSNRMFGIRLPDLEMIKEVLIFATGKEKIPSMKALMKRNFIDYLIIDSDIADALVEGI